MRRFTAFSNIFLGGPLAFVVSTAPAQAQLATQHIKGVTGLKAGSQPPPHIYLLAPLVYAKAQTQGSTFVFLSTWFRSRSRCRSDGIAARQSETRWRT